MEGSPGGEATAACFHWRTREYCSTSYDPNTRCPHHSASLGSSLVNALHNISASRVYTLGVKWGQGREEFGMCPVP